MNKLIAKLTKLQMEICRCICDEHVCMCGEAKGRKLTYPCRLRNAALLRAMTRLNEATHELRLVQDMEALKR